MKSTKNETITKTREDASLRITSNEGIEES